jgi:predicted DCC family thiol-disulfide oxidoreductase YuxK
MIPKPDRHFTILFDGFCNLCDGLTGFVMARDIRREFRFLPLQSDEGRATLARHGLGEKYLSSLVLIDKRTGSEKVSVRSEAAIRILTELPGGLWSWARALLWIPRPLRDLGYSLIAALRYRLFGKKEVCELAPRARADG